MRSSKLNDKKRTNRKVERIIRQVATRFPSFGGGKLNPDNSLSKALVDFPPQFAAGVSIEEVVRFVLSKAQ